MQRYVVGLSVFFAFLVGTALAGGGATPVVTGVTNPAATAVGIDGKVYLSIKGEAGKPGSGGVVVVRDGKAVPFATGLDDPRGLAAWSQWLFVVGKTQVWRVDQEGKATVFAAAAAFPSSPRSLQAIDIDEQGNLYVSDPGDPIGEGSALYRINTKGRVQRITEAKRSPALRAPHGLVLEGASFALISDAATEEVFRLKLADGSTSKLAEGFGGSLAWDKFGRLFLSDPKRGRLAAIPRPGVSPVLLASDLRTPGGISIDPSGKSVLMPDTSAGTLAAVSTVIPGWEVDDRPLGLETAIAFPDLQWAGWKPEDDRGRIVPLRPIVLTHAGDGTNRVFVATQHGVIHVFPNDQKATRTEIFLDIQERAVYNDKQNEQGFLGLAFHPRFKENGEFFVFYTLEKPDLTNVVSRFRVRKDNPNRADPGSEEELLRLRTPFWNHDGGTLCFGPDGYLYVAIGDGGAANDPFNHGQDLSKLFGKILRLDVDRKEGGKPYAIPRDNPFVNRPGAQPEIWAYGLRNVWRMAFDRKTGVLWAADVGQNLYEEIDLIERRGNYGWSVREGLHPFSAKGSGPRKDLIDPIWEYHHDVGKSVTGGAVYRGQRLPELQGSYLYADYVSSKIWALRHDEAQRRVVANRPIPDPKAPVLSFGEDEQGEIYFLTYTNSGRGIYWFVRPGAVKGK